MLQSPHLQVNNLTMAYADTVIQQDLNFSVQHGEIFIIMGGSGCGKSTLLRHLIGLMAPASGEILIGGTNIWNCTAEERTRMISRSGVLYQSGALFSSMTLFENIALPLTEYCSLTKEQISKIVSYKLSLVGLRGFEDYYPSEISGGMRKRAGLARAIALDPEILFIDEPTAGLDPVSSKLLDRLILELRDSQGTTVIMVTHELESIFAIGDTAIFLDTDDKTMIASGPPRHLLEQSTDERVRNFLTRSD